jgi:hypothetical protein
LPQWDAKARFIQIDRFSLKDIVIYARDRMKQNSYQWFATDPDLVKGLSKRYFSFEQIRRAFPLLFKLPRSKNKVCDTITTDLKRICWNFNSARINTKNAVKRRKLADEVPLQSPDTLPNGFYFHGKDFFMDESPNVDFIFIDPGHVNIMTGVREFAGEMFDSKQAAQSAYKLTNRRNMHETGNFLRRLKAQKERNKDLPYRDACNELQNFSAKTWDPGKYLTHIACYLRNWQPLFKHSFKPYVRHFAFASYQAKQRRVMKIRDELQSPTGRKTIVVVGDGVNSATSRGHDAAPGKELRKQLARFLPIVMAPERGTTKKSSCCNRLTIRGHYDKNNKCKAGWLIRGLVHCTRCATTFDRDVNSALNIRSLFWTQALAQTHDNYLDE